MAKDAEVQESNGRKRLRLRVAVHDSGPDGATHFFTVVYFGAGEEQAAGLTKGRVVRLAGRVTAWKDQEGKERLSLVPSEVAATARGDVDVARQEPDLHELVEEAYVALCRARKQIARTYKKAGHMWTRDPYPEELPALDAAIEQLTDLMVAR